MDPPSSRLVQILRDLRLCAPSDLRRCRGHVRRLARDIPTFDSVWIDALLHQRLLTPFQARALESDQPEQLRVGPCVLADRLGGGRFSTTFLARRLDGNERCVLKLFALPPDLVERRRRGLEIVADRLKGFDHPGAVGPSQALVHAGKLVCLSRPVDGPHLGDLLVRRGRFQPGVVLDIAGQLIDALAALEDRGVVHGDICLRNIRMTDAGQAVLTDAGVLPAVFPELTIHAGLAPDRYDGVAPERIGAGRPPDAASDIYALGCLLWQLLAGRPPYPTNDPLGKLASHQTKTIADVRDWAPDTPPLLAEAIAVFTRPNPAARPPSFGALRAKWGPGKSGARRRLAAFRRQFSMPAPYVPTVGAAGRAGFWPTIAALLLLLSGVSVTLFHERAKATLLSVRGETARWLRPITARDTSATSASNASTDAVPNLSPLPAPDARGVIELPHAGPWEPGQVAAAGVLVVRGNPHQPARILVSDTPWKLSAERVKLENLIVRQTPPTGEDSARSKSLKPLADGDERSDGALDGADDSHEINTLIEIEANRFEMRTCDVVANRRADRESSSMNSIGVDVAAVSWTALDGRGRREPLIGVVDTVIRVPGPALRLRSAPAVVQIRNVLAVGTAEFARVESSHAAAKRLHLDLARLTLRGGTALLRLPSDPGRPCGQISVDAADCVFALDKAGAALVQFSGRRPPEGWTESLRFGGEGSLLAGGVEVAGLVASDRTVPLDTSNVEIEGLTGGAFEFQGEEPPDAETSAANLSSVVRRWDAPRRGSTPPGIDPTRFLGSK